MARASLWRASAVGAAAGWCLLALNVGAAAARSAPADALFTAAAPAAVTAPLATAPFALGEVDLSTLGVPLSDFATVGLAGATTTTAGDGPNMFIVDDDHLDCPNAQFTSIQAAVLVAGPNDSIKVCPGTYREQVEIPPGKDGLQLFSLVPLEAVIQAPLVMTVPKSIVTVAGSTNVTIRQFTITGPYTEPGCSPDRHTGVRVTAGSATIYGNHVTLIRDVNPAFFGCQDGIAIQVGRALQAQVGAAVVRQNLVDNYQKGGIVVDGQGSYGELRQNEVVGSGPTPTIAQNGIQISRDAHALVDHNRVTRNAFGVPPVPTDAADATGILLYNLHGGVQASYNDVYANEDGIVLDNFDGDFHVGTTDNVEVSHNDSHDNFLDGVDAFDGTENNPIAYNKLYGNAEFDCADFTVGPYNSPALVANPWIKDQGDTENRPGLCKNARVVP